MTRAVSGDESGGTRASLHGLDPIEALRALLAVDPDSEPVEEDDPTDDVSGNDEAPAN